VFLLTVAGITIGLGSWATTGSTDITRTTWFHVAVGVAITAVVLAVIGGVGAFLTRTDDITPTHAETLQRALDAVTDCIKQGVICEYGDPAGSTVGRDSFPHHFRRLKLGSDGSRWCATTRMP
jgi:hypothetical protein